MGTLHFKSMLITHPLVASQEDYIDPDSFNDDDNYVEPEEHPASSKEAWVVRDELWKKKAQQWCQWSSYLYPLSFQRPDGT